MSDDVMDRMLRAAERWGGRPALEVAGVCLNYAQLRDLGQRYAAALGRPEKSAARLSAVFAYRSVVAYAGVWAALWRGQGYVPLNRTFPVERTALMLRESGCTEVIVDSESAAQLEQVVAEVGRSLTILMPDVEDVSEWTERLPGHRVIGAESLRGAVGWDPIGAKDSDLAYLLFTSGSTGRPKGVQVTRGNVAHYVRHISVRYEMSERDRCSQTFDQTFDLSVHDMFLTWSNGACLCVLGQRTLLNPGPFIESARLTVWFSVPSVVVFMKRLGALKPGRYGGLRLSLFCGEALPLEVARAWQEAAPNSRVENIYGPTELTIACTGYVFDAARAAVESEMGIVPIGEPFPGMEVRVVDESLAEVRPGDEGELVATGPQLSPGYWRDEERTRRAFVTLPGKSGIYYRTGDRVRRPRVEGGPLVYLGRIDFQIKVLGHRVELGEVEAVVREESGVDGVVAVGWPLTSGGAGGVEVFLETESIETGELVRVLEKRLPVYMVPRRVHCRGRLPLNSNGKYDRPALMRWLAEEGGAG